LKRKKPTKKEKTFITCISSKSCFYLCILSRSLTN